MVGLEVHARLRTRTKLFSSDLNAFGSAPNTQVSPISLAHPGSLPMLNRQALTFAIRLGLATGSSITRENYFSRKNYFYPDLPKGFQVTQLDTPICRGGMVEVESNGETKAIRLHQIHLEEDAGKSTHDAHPGFSLVDLNRAGSPLVEIVTEPDMRSAAEAGAFLAAVRKLVRHLGICDGNMEEGSLRCDANVSVRKKGDTTLGTRVEIKNLNSIRFLEQAIQFESDRLVDLLETGMEVSRETRHFDDATGTTFPSRDKEDAEDYRYFPEPDLCPVFIEESLIEEIRHSMPIPLADTIRHYTGIYGLSEQDARLLVEDGASTLLFEEFLADGISPRAAINWISGPLRAWANEHQTGLENFPLAPAAITQLIRMVEEGSISYSAGSSRLLKLLLENPGQNAMDLAIANQLLRLSDTAALEAYVDEVLLKFADRVEAYRKGKKGLLGLFVGEVMKRSGGAADPGLVNELIINKIKEQSK